MGRADPGHDRGRALVWLPHGGSAAGHEQEHGPADLSAQGWQLRKRPLGQWSRIEAKVSRAEKPDLCLFWGGKDGWLGLALVIECSPRQLLGLAPITNRQGAHCVGRAGTGPHHALRHVGAGAGAFPAALGQRAGVYLPRLHASGAQLWPAAGVHYPALPHSRTGKWNG